MTYFNYHATAQNLIKTGHCLKAELVKKHNAISPALVLIFNNHKPMPIRIEKWFLYFKLLNDFNIEIINNLTI